MANRAIVRSNEAFSLHISRYSNYDEQETDFDLIEADDRRSSSIRNQ